MIPSYKQLEVKTNRTSSYTDIITDITTRTQNIKTHNRHKQIYQTNVTNMLLVEPELLTVPEHLNSPPVFSGLRNTRYLFFCAVFCSTLFVLVSFLFGLLHCLSEFVSLKIVSKCFGYFFGNSNWVYVLGNNTFRLSIFTSSIILHLIDLPFNWLVLYLWNGWV